MTRCVALLVIALGCSSPRTGREADCAKVRRVIAEVTEGVPRRYRDAVLQARARQQLRQIEYTDREVERAATTDEPTYDAIEEACTTHASDRERDCSYLRPRLEHMPLFADRARGVGILDESGLRELAERPYRDPAVKQAMLVLGRVLPIAFYTPNDDAPAPAADERAHAAYDAVAQLCGP